MRKSNTFRRRVFWSMAAAIQGVLRGIEWRNKLKKNMTDFDLESVTFNYRTEQVTVIAYDKLSGRKLNIVGDTPISVIKGEYDGIGLRQKFADLTKSELGINDFLTRRDPNANHPPTTNQSPKECSNSDSR